MSKVRIIVFAAAIGLATWAAAVFARDGGQIPNVFTTQIDTFDLMSKAGNLPVETAPEV